MNLQVKRVTGPDQIFIDAEVQDDSVAAQKGKTTDYGTFACELSEPVQGDTSIILQFYNSRGTSIREQSLTVTEGDMAGNTFHFIIAPGKELSGSSFYVHAIIPASDENAQNVSFLHSSYHETIKHVQVCSEKKINHVYWSDSDEIKTVEQEENRVDSAEASDKRYLHLKTVGMYSDTVELTITAEGVTEDLQKIDIPLHRNRRAVTVSMRDALARYCSIKGLSGDTTDLTFNLKATVTFNDGKYTLEKTADTMQVKGSKSENRDKADNSGAVFVVAGNGNGYEDTPLRYTDFLLGYMCHIEGIGKLALKNDNDAVVTKPEEAYYTVYPFHVYEIMLSDLVKCGLVTLDEAACLTSVDNKKEKLKSKAVLEEKFNKITDKLSKEKTLTGVFRDAANNNLAHSENIRKLLAQVRHKPTKFEKQKFICRDAWEIVSSKKINEKTEEEKTADGKTTIVETKREGFEVTELWSRPDTHRYSKHKECPFGEFFLNYIASTYRVYASRNSTNSKIDTYEADGQAGRPEAPNPIERSGIAIHKGGANASVGCLTFNINYGTNGHYSEFHTLLYEKNSNANKLNFLCIDERNAVKLPDDTKSYTGNDVLKDIPDRGTGKRITIKKNDSFDFKRYYDLVKPANAIPVVKETVTAREKKETKEKTETKPKTK